jgi:uncharacterized protein DUF6916
MTTSRRRFLRTGLLATLFAALPLENVLAQSWKQNDGNPGEISPVQTDPLANYSKSSFASYLNSVFQVETVSGVVAVTLARVDDLPAAKGGECFSLLFRGGSLPLKQDTYMVVHPALGTFQLFVVPGGSDQNGARAYVATINRLSPADFANMSAPKRIAVGTRTNNTQANSPASNSTVTGSSTSPAGPGIQVTAAPMNQTNAGPATNTIAPQLSLPSRHRKRKPARKRVDANTVVDH